MKWMRGKCACGKDHTEIKLNGPDWIIIGLLIGLLFFTPMGCTIGMSKQKQIEMSEREEWG
jgi:hypothetical protein